MLLLPVRTEAGISAEIGVEDESPISSAELPSPLVDEIEVDAVSGSTSMVTNLFMGCLPILLSSTDSFIVLLVSNPFFGKASVGMYDYVLLQNRVFTRTMINNDRNNNLTAVAKREDSHTLLLNVTPCSITQKSAMRFKNKRQTNNRIIIGLSSCLFVSPKTRLYMYLSRKLNRTNQSINQNTKIDFNLRKNVTENQYSNTTC